MDPKILEPRVINPDDFPIEKCEGYDEYLKDQLEARMFILANMGNQDLFPDEPLDITVNTDDEGFDPDKDLNTSKFKGDLEDGIFDDEQGYPFG